MLTMPLAYVMTMSLFTPGLSVVAPQETIVANRADIQIVRRQNIWH